MQVTCKYAEKCKANPPENFYKCQHCNPHEKNVGCDNPMCCIAEMQVCECENVNL